MKREITQWLSTLTTTTNIISADSVSRFNLALNKQFYIEMYLPENMTISFSPNVQSLLGFYLRSEPFRGDGVEKKFVGDILPSTLDKREQELFIYTDIAEEMNYGSDKFSILAQFIHKHDSEYGIVQKSFDPIIYLPLRHTSIREVTVKLLTSWRACASIADSKSLLVLQFRPQGR